MASSFRWCEAAGLKTWKPRKQEQSAARREAFYAERRINAELSLGRAVRPETGLSNNASCFDAPVGLQDGEV